MGRDVIKKFTIDAKDPWFCHCTTLKQGRIQKLNKILTIEMSRLINRECANQKNQSVTKKQIWGEREKVHIFLMNQLVFYNYYQDYFMQTENKLLNLIITEN